MGDQNQDIPVEIITDILKRLPAKSLVRFRCVSKPWLSLLTNPNFIKSHLKRNRSTFQSNTNSTRLILSRYCDTLMDSSIDSGANNNVLQAAELDFKIVNNIPYYVKGHSDGLLCIVANDGIEGMLLIYNPTIHEYRKLPSPDNFRSTREAIGIGYDPTIDDYKVVRVPSNYCSRKVRGYEPGVEVLSLKSNTWRRLPKEDTPPYFVEHIFQATEVNGGLYWFVEEPETLKCVILRFDLVKEKFKVVAPPPDGSISWIGPLKDWLCVVHRRRLSEVCVWGTKDDVKWTKIITTTTMSPTVVGMDHCLERMRCMPLCYTDKGAVLMCVKGEKERFLTFDQRNNVFEHVDIRGAKHWLQETVYCESLVSPGVGVHSTEKARSSGSRVVVAPADGQEDEEGEADGDDNSLELIRGLKRELSNLLSLTIGFRGAQG